MITGGDWFRAARLALQLPKESRFVQKLDPSVAWEWRDHFLMMMNQSLRQLVWSKTKDAQKKTPHNAPELIAPEFILKAIKEQQAKDKSGPTKYTPNARVMEIDDLDRYLKRPRKSIK